MRGNDSVTHADYVPLGDVVVKCAVAVLGAAMRPGFVRFVVNCGIRRSIETIISTGLRVDARENFEMW